MLNSVSMDTTDFKVNAARSHFCENGYPMRARVCVLLCLIVVWHTCVRLLVSPFVFPACMINACGRSHTSTDTQQQHFNTQHRTKNIAFQLRTSMDAFAYSPTFSDYIQRMAFFRPARCFNSRHPYGLFRFRFKCFGAPFRHSFPPFLTGAVLFHFDSILTL